jgi:hypothetical protein
MPQLITKLFVVTHAGVLRIRRAVAIVVWQIAKGLEFDLGETA